MDLPGTSECRLTTALKDGDMAHRVWLLSLTFVAFVGVGCQSDSARRAPLTAGNTSAVPPGYVAVDPTSLRAHATKTWSASSSVRPPAEPLAQNEPSADHNIEPEALASAVLEELELVEQDVTVTELVSFDERPLLEDQSNPDDLPRLIAQAEPDGWTVDETGASAVSEDPVSLNDSRYVIDLPTVMRLSGTDNWGVRLAYERICEAQARLDAAEVLWLPSLNLGIGYTKHDGQIQATNGQVVDVSRSSLFVGGSAVTADAPATGGSGGPARLFVDLSLADAIFQPLAARQNVNVTRSSHTKVFNDTQLEASLAYYDLVAAQGMLAITVENLTDATRLEEMTQAFVAAGKSSEAEAMRVGVVVANRRQDVIDAELAIHLASARLAQLIQLDPLEFGIGSLLQSVETHIVSVELIPAEAPLDGLIAQGRGMRAEVAEESFRVQSQYELMRQERWRPWLPNVQVGLSGGVFGGNPGGSLNGLDGRSDIDALLVWQIRNLGFGVGAARREQNSRYRQAVLRSWQIQDLIAAEVKQAWSEADARRQQIDITRETLESAKTVYDRNILRIRGLEGLPLEAIQALDAVAESRTDHLTAVIRFNRAQLMLLRAIGQPLESY